MLIDWFTVGAQALNFAVLVWLLKRFLYGPILNAVDAREARIAAELANAKEKMADAEKEREAFQRKNDAFDQQRANLLKKATDDAATERQRLLDEARKATDAFSAKRQEALRSDARNLDDAICRRTQQEVFAIARKALADLATDSLEARMVEVCIARLRALDGKAKEEFAKALTTRSEPPLVRSAFDLPTAQRAALQKALGDQFSFEAPVRFEASPDLVSGIELTTNGQKIAWSISDYLRSLQNGVDDLLNKSDKAAAATTSKADRSGYENPKPENATPEAKSP